MKKVITGGKITFTFEGAESVVFDSTLVSSENRDYAMMHGFLQRIGDNAAIPRNGGTVTEIMRREAVLEMVMHLESGTKDWNMRVSDKKPKQDASILAIAMKRGCTYEEAQVWFTEKMLAELS